MSCNLEKVILFWRYAVSLGITRCNFKYSFSFNITFSVFIISAVVALLLINLQKRTKLAGDSLLGLLAHSTLAIGSEY